MKLLERKRRAANLMRNFLNTVDQTHLVQSVDQGGKAAVDAKNPAVYDSRDVHAVKHVAASFPNGSAAVPGHAVTVLGAQICNVKD